MRPYVQEIIDLTKQVDDLTSDNVDLEDQIRDLHVDKDNLLSVIKLYEKQKDILWEYISDKNVDEISSRFDKLQ